MHLPEYAVENLRQKADELAAGFVSRPGAAGLAVGVITGDEQFFFGYGRLAKADGRVPDEHTVFEIGSVT
jgi:CubicO group peptidase (beta-lactamase class C family)